MFLGTFIFATICVAFGSTSQPMVDFFNLKGYEKFEHVPLNVRMQVEYETNSNGSPFARDRPGKATETHSCNNIRAVPTHLTFVTRYNYYQKYTEAYGIPIVSSGNVPDEALKRACYTVRFLFADRKDVRDTMYRKYGRFGIIGKTEKTNGIPEFKNLPDWWNKRARGLGGVLGNPISTGAEENILCQRPDGWYGDDIFFHEASHGVAEVALRGGGIPGFYTRLTAQYKSALAQGLWKNTYAATDTREYFAEGMQSFFNCHIEANPPNGIHNTIDTHDELKNYDRGLYDLIKEVYPCMNKYHRCKVNPPDMKMNCGGTNGGTKPTTTTTTTTKACKDKNKHCSGWAKQNFCQNNRYVKANCKKSCQTC